VCFFFFPFLKLFSGSTYYPRVRAAQPGIWQGDTDIETPAEYEKRIHMGERMITRDVEPEDLKREVEKVLGFWSRIFGRRKKDGDKVSL